MPSVLLGAGGGVDPLVHDIGFCVLFAGVLVVIFSRLRIPTIAALLVAGILLGPETGGVTVDRGSIATIANLGIVLLLFLIGLEIDLRKLLRSGRTLLLTGLLQFPLCVLVGWAAAKGAAAAGWAALAEGHAPLYVGIVAGASSTLVVVRLLQERFQMDSVVGRLAVGLLIIQDIWAIIVLALQPNLHAPELKGVVSQFAGIAILIAIATMLSRHVVPTALRWIASTPELLLVAATGFCFGVGFLGVNLGALAEAVGIHAPISVSLEMGALIAGASLASHPFSHHIVSRVSVVHDFFITLFFVALGAGIPRPEGLEVLLLAAFMAVVAVACRYVVFLPLLYLTGLDRRNAVVASTRLAQISEFCLVIAFLGLGMKHVDGTFVSAVIFAFVGTALLAPLIFDIGDRLHARLGGVLSLLGFREPGARKGEDTARTEYDLALLGFHRVASSLFHELERKHPAILRKTLVVDINAGIHDEISRRGGVVHYADLASLESLQAAGVGDAKVAICTVPDELLRGTTNLRIVRMVRSLAPKAVVVANSLTLEGVRELYEAGADYVYMQRVETAVGLTPAVRAALDGTIAIFRKDQEALFGNPGARDEVLP